MTEQRKKYLSDIVEAIRKIELFTKDTPSFALYSQDIKTQSAVERQLGIIGEAVNKLDKAASPFDSEVARQIVGFRNRLIHAYDSMDNTIVWAILQRHIPVLKQAATKLIAS